MIIIDGSIGEGGGQILRSALALSMVTGKAFRIENIRANRAKPGLLRQHLTCVHAAAAICHAAAEGATMGSRQLTFTPGAIEAGSYTFAIGTAGSTTLVLQAVLPALLTAAEPSSLTLEGGTHNPMAPPLDFLQKAFLPLVQRMGPKVQVNLQRAGFYPAGGGRVLVNIEPARLSPLHLPERGGIVRRQCIATVAGLSRGIAERELEQVGKRMNWPEESFHVREFPADQGPGNILTIEVGCEQVTEVFTGFGERGIRAEAVADQAVDQLRQYLAAANVPVGEYLADQLLLPMALAGGGSFVSLPLSRHSTTNIQIIGMFLDVRISATATADKQCKIEVVDAKK